MSLLLLWNGTPVGAVTPPVVGTITLGGGGSRSTRQWAFWRRWEPVTEEVEPEPVAEAPPTPKRRIGKPARPADPPQAEPFPDFEPERELPEPEPEPAIRAAIDAVLAAPVRLRRPRVSHRYWQPPVGVMPTRPGKVVLVTRYWGGLGLALLMQRQGSDLVVATDYAGVKPKELPATKKIGDALVRKVPLETALRQMQGQGTLWVFDSNDLPHEADRLRAAGEAVIGTSALSQHVEDDRDFAAQLAEDVGFSLPETQKFTDYDQAIAYLEQHGDQAFVFKPDKQDPTMTYVPLEKDDPAKANEELREYLHSITGTHAPSFIVQEVVNGIEANVELWLRRGEPVAAFCDLESKRKLVGDLGDNLGCAGDYVLRLGLDTPLVRATVGQYLGRPELARYTGSVDANVMLKDGQVYFLENCFRFGYNAYPVLFQALATQPMEPILRTWVGGGSLDGAFQDGFGASLSLVCDHPKDGTPLMLPTNVAEQVYLYRAYHDTDHLAMVEEWPEVACVTAYGATMAAAGQECLTVAEEVAFPGKGYRVDLVDDDLSTLPIPRYEALQQLGLLPGDTRDDEDALSAILGVLE